MAYDPGRATNPEWGHLWCSTRTLVILAWKSENRGSPMLSRRGMLAGLSGLSIAGCAQHPAAPLPVAGPDPRIDYDKLANPRADFAASLWPSVPSLRPGMPLSLAMRSSIAGYASLFAAHSSNATSQLIGNRVIGAGETRSVGPYQAVPPAGLETYILVVTRAPLV